MDSKITKEVLALYKIKREKILKETAIKKEEAKLKLPKIVELEDNINKLSIELLKNSMCSDLLKKDIQNENLKIKIEENNKKIEDLLDKNGYDKEYFKPNYECKKCGDTGYLKIGMCSCLKQEILNRTYKQSNMNKLKEENFTTFDIGFYSDEVKPEYQNTKSPKQNILKIKNVAENFCKNIDDKNELNLLFVGNTGLGKTFLSNSIAFEVMKNGYSAIYQTSSLLMDLIIKYKFTYNKDEKIQTEYNKLFETDLLIIDDLGTETVNNMKFTELFNIINTRLLNNKKIVISTNLSLEKLYELYDERIVSRLIGEFRICRFYGDDIRLKKKRLLV